MNSGRKRRPQPALIIGVIALILALTGIARAAWGPDTVGSRQLKAGAVTNSDFADSAVNGRKVKDRSLTGKDVNLATLSTVPSATEAAHAQNASRLDGHDFACGSQTIYVRGSCYDVKSSGPVTGVQTAADKCAERGGFLPTPMQLIATRNVLDLGDGSGSHSQFTDSYAYDTTGGNPKVIVVNQSGEDNPTNEDTKTHVLIATYEFICAYRPIR
jgi:hypothetical protein